MLLIFLLFRAFTVRDFACSSDETDCFREWVSALGGWAAVAAAAPTIFFLSRQISDANRHQQETMRVQLAKSRAIARRAKFEGFYLANAGAIGAKKWNEAQTPGYEVQLTNILIDIRSVRTAKFIPTARKFEQEIGIERGVLIEDILSRIEDYENSFESFANTTNYLGHAQWAEHTFRMLEEYGDTLLKAAENYLQDTDMLMGKSSH